MNTQLLDEFFETLTPEMKNYIKQKFADEEKQQKQKEAEPSEHMKQYLEIKQNKKPEHKASVSTAMRNFLKTK